MKIRVCSGLYISKAFLFFFRQKQENIGTRKKGSKKFTLANIARFFQ
jgi:hypothetical protein